MKATLLLGLLVGALGAHGQSVIYLHTPAAGDANYSWNSRYAGDAYAGVGGNTVNAYRSFFPAFLQIPSSR